MALPRKSLQETTFFAARTQDPGDDADSVPFALLHQGYVLTKALIQGAGEELSNEESPHRALAVCCPKKKAKFRVLPISSRLWRLWQLVGMLVSYRRRH